MQVPLDSGRQHLSRGHHDCEGPSPGQERHRRRQRVSPDHVPRVHPLQRARHDATRAVGSSPSEEDHVRRRGGLARLSSCRRLCGDHATTSLSGCYASRAGRYHNRDRSTEGRALPLMGKGRGFKSRLFHFFMKKWNSCCLIRLYSKMTVSYSCEYTPCGAKKLNPAKTNRQAPTKPNSHPK